MKNLIKILVFIFTIIAGVGFVLSIFYFRDLSEIILGIYSILIAILWFLHIDVFGIESIRGQFRFIMAFGFLSFGLSLLLFKTFSYFISLLAVSRLIFSLANIRYSLFFMLRGYAITILRLFIVLLILAIFLFILFILGHHMVKPINSLYGWLFIVADIIVFAIIIYNTLLLWGSEAGRL